MPAIFDECGCDDTGCQPIGCWSQHEFDVLVDQPAIAPDHAGVGIKWISTLNLAQAKTVAVDPVGSKLYVLSGPAAANLYQLRPEHERGTCVAFLASTAGLDVTVSADGKQVFALVHDSADADPKILVLDALNLANPPLQTLSITGARATEARITLAPDGSVFAINPTTNQVMGWQAVTFAVIPPVAVGPNPVAIAIPSAASISTSQTAERRM